MESDTWAATRDQHSLWVARSARGVAKSEDVLGIPGAMN
jgi:hypothetical protein